MGKMKASWDEDGFGVNMKCFWEEGNAVEDGYLIFA